MGNKSPLDLQKGTLICPKRTNTGTITKMQVLAITKNNLIKIMLELRIGYVTTNMFAGLITHFFTPSYGLLRIAGPPRYFQKSFSQMSLSELNSTSLWKLTRNHLVAIYWKLISPWLLFIEWSPDTALWSGGGRLWGLRLAGCPNACSV